MISQELFDETLLENQDLFSLSPSSALQETIEEFTVRQKTSVSHLVLLHPESSEGKEERRKRGEYNDWLNLLDGLIERDGSVKDVDEKEGMERAVGALQGVRRCCKDGWTRQNDENNGSTTVESENTVTNPDFKNDKNNSTSLPYLTLFHQSSAIYTFMSLLGIIPLPSSPEEEEAKTATTPSPYSETILHETIQTLIEIIRPSTITSATREIKMILRDKFVAFERLVGLIYYYTQLCCQENEKEKATRIEILSDLINLATASCKMCEANKVSFVKACKNKSNYKNGGGGVNAIMEVLHLPSPSSPTTEEITLWSDTCDLMNTLCKYDDFRVDNKTQSSQQHGLNVSCAHDHVMEFFRAGVVPILHTIISHSLNDVGEDENVDLELAAAAMGATRVLAVNDEIVQCLVAVGILNSARIALDAGLSLKSVEKEDRKEEDAKIRLTSASLGLLRNLCGNDEIKTTLCLGTTTTTLPPSASTNSISIVPSIINAMKKYKNNPTVQEHGCGTFAAMSLRKPKNALRILQDDGAKMICTCMKRFPNVVPLQRQGCLAVRNIVSRLVKIHSAEEGETETTSTAAAAGDDGGTINVREVFLDLGVEQILRNVAGRHQGSVDEAYAALRDLGCQVSLVKFDAGEDGESVKPVGRTMMFGETKPKFRPVFEESEGLNGGGESGGGIEDRIAAIAEENGGVGI